MSWKKIFESRDLGALDIIDIRFFNVARLGKWI